LVALIVNFGSNQQACCTISPRSESGYRLLSDKRSSAAAASNIPLFLKESTLFSVRESAVPNHPCGFLLIELRFSAFSSPDPGLKRPPG
jgi:hypothetical protein